MPKVRLPISAVDDKQTDELGLDSLNRVQKNGYFAQSIDGSGELAMTWNKRPGLTEWCNLGEAAGVDGLFWWPRQQKLVATCNGKTFFVTEGGVATDKTGTAPMVAGVRPTYADVGGSVLFQASSGKIGKYELVTNGVYLTDPDAPTTCSHIGTNNKLLIALHTNSEQFDWAVVNDPDTWEGDFASAESGPDLAVGLHVSNGQVIIPGQNTTEFWKDNGTTFARVAGGTIESGCIAPYSFTLVDGIPYWINENREVVRLKGRTPQPISQAYSKYIQNLSEVEDARGSYVKVAGKNLYVLYFPTANETLVFDIDLSRWYTWTNSTDQAYNGGVFVNVGLWGYSLVGDRTTGKIYKMEPSAEYDTGTVAISTVLRTDSITHGSTEKRKFSNKLTLHFKRTYDGTSPATMTVRWRDDGADTWKASRTFTIEDGDKTDVSITLPRLGSYFSRQYEFLVDTPSKTALVSVEEDITL